MAAEGPFSDIGVDTELFFCFGGFSTGVVGGFPATFDAGVVGTLAAGVVGGFPANFDARAVGTLAAGVVGGFPANFSTGVVGTLAAGVVGDFPANLDAGVVCPSLPAFARLAGGGGLLDAADDFLFIFTITTTSLVYQMASLVARNH